MEIDEDKEKGGWTKIYNQQFINLPCYKKDTMSKQLVIRVQSPQGNKRVTASPTESLKTFLDKVRKEFELGPTGWNCYTGRDKRKELKPLSATSQVAGVKHRDMLYLFGPEAAKESPSSTAASTSNASAAINGAMVKPPTEGGQRVVRNRFVMREGGSCGRCNA